MFHPYRAGGTPQAARICPCGERYMRPLREGAPDRVGWGRMRKDGVIAIFKISRAPSVTLRVPPPFTQGRLWAGCNHTATNNPCRGDSRIARNIALFSDITDDQWSPLRFMISHRRAGACSRRNIRYFTDIAGEHCSPLRINDILW